MKKNRGEKEMNATYRIIVRITVHQIYFQEPFILDFFSITKVFVQNE
jgi:hypothetical protein